MGRKLCIRPSASSSSVCVLSAENFFIVVLSRRILFALFDLSPESGNEFVRVVCDIDSGLERLNDPGAFGAAMRPASKASKATPNGERPYRQTSYPEQGRAAAAAAFCCWR